MIRGLKVAPYRMRWRSAAAQNVASVMAPRLAGAGRFAGSVLTPAAKIGDVNQVRAVQDLPTQHDSKGRLAVGQFDHTQFQFRRLRGDELVANGSQRDVVQL